MSSNTSNVSAGNQNPTDNKTVQQTTSPSQTNPNTTEKKDAAGTTTTNQTPPATCNKRWYYWLFGSVAVVGALAGFAFLMKAKRHHN